MMDIFGTIWAMTPTIFFSIAVFSTAFVLILIKKTPARAFFKAFMSGTPILEVDRKDGGTHFVTGKYDAGTIRNDRYGVFIVDSEGVKREMKSGAKILRCVDSIGITMSEKIVDIVRGLKNMGFKDYDDVHKYLNLLIHCKGEIEAKVCEKCKWIITDLTATECTDCKGPLIQKKVLCGFEGIGMPKTIENDVLLSCPRCGGTNVEHTHLDINTPLFKTAGTSDYEQFFKYNFNPDRTDVIVKRLVKSEMTKEKSFPVKYIAIGIMVLLVCFGIGLAYMMIAPQIATAAQTAAAQSSAVQNVPLVGGILQ